MVTFFQEIRVKKNARAFLKIINLKDCVLEKIY